MRVNEPKEYAAALEVALRAARAAAAVHESHRGRVAPEAWSTKGIADFVTYVDREAEAEIIACISAAFPDHAILAEESADENSGGELAPWTWIADPLDGTTNFLHQYPMYCSSVGLLHNGAPVAAAVVCSATNEEWTASQGGGAHKDGVRIEVSPLQRLDRALIGTGFPFKLPELLPAYLRQFEHIIRRVSDIRRGGSAALDLCFVASGCLDGFWELDLRPWDYAAGVLMIREAQGTASGLAGEPVWTPAGGGIIAGNSFIYGEIVRMLAEVRA